MQKKSWFTVAKEPLTSKPTYDQFLSSITQSMEKHGEWVPFLDKTKFDLIMKSSSPYHPVIAFHATSTQDVVNSILTYGHVLPGEILLSTGEPIKMRIGNLFGN